MLNQQSGVVDKNNSQMYEQNNLMKFVKWN